MKDLLLNPIVQIGMAYLGVCFICLSIILRSISNAWIEDSKTGRLINPKNNKDNV